MGCCCWGSCVAGILIVVVGCQVTIALMAGQCGLDYENDFGVQQFQVLSSED